HPPHPHSTPTRRSSDLRLSSSDPNLQNIPNRTDRGKQIRKAFIAQEGWLILTADYSQIELRVLAHLAKDEEMIDAFRSGEDIHRSEEHTSELQSRVDLV